MRLNLNLHKSTNEVLVMMQPGDVPSTFADSSALHELTGFKPSTPIAEELKNITWYKEYYEI